MTLGMILGMILYPIVMKIFKEYRERIKIKKILKDVANKRKNTDSIKDYENQIQ